MTAQDAPSPRQAQLAKINAVREAADRLRLWFEDEGASAAPLPEVIAVHAVVLDALLNGVREESIANALGFAGSPSSNSAGLQVVCRIATDALVPSIESLALGLRVERALAYLVGAGDSLYVRTLRAILLGEDPDGDEGSAP